jgi:hypothetical protein
VYIPSATGVSEGSSILPDVICTPNVPIVSCAAVDLLLLITSFSCWCPWSPFFARSSVVAVAVSVDVPSVVGVLLLLVSCCCCLPAVAGVNAVANFPAFNVPAVAGDPAFAVVFKNLHLDYSTIGLQFSD